MTTKASPRKERPRESAAPPPEQLMQTAYQAHTLAQMIYGQMTMARPWPAPTPSVVGYEPLHGFAYAPVVPPWAGMWGMHPTPWVTTGLWRP